MHAKGMKSSIPKAVKRRATKAKNALFGMFGICHGLKVYDIQVLNRLFDGIVLPSALYGAEVWGPDVFELAKGGMVYMPLEETLFMYMRMALMVGKATPHSIMLRETGNRLLIQNCCYKSIGFWNKMCDMDENCLVYKALRVNMGLHGVGWVHSFRRMIAGLSNYPGTLEGDGVLAQIDKKLVCGDLASMFRNAQNSVFEDIHAMTDSMTGSKVRSCPDAVRTGFKVFKHTRWFETDDDTPVITMLHDAYDIRVMAKYRCGMHWLATEKERVRGCGRSERKCMLCDSNEREDELHLLFCSAYESLRHVFDKAFDSDLYMVLKHEYVNMGDMVDCHMKSFMNQKDVDFQLNMVGYLRRSIVVRDRLLSGRSIQDRSDIVIV
jgi:hypothetical protein